MNGFIRANLGMIAILVSLIIIYDIMDFLTEKRSLTHRLIDIILCSYFIFYIISYLVGAKWLTT